MQGDRRSAAGWQGVEEPLQSEQTLLIPLWDLFTHSFLLICLLSSVWVVLQVKGCQIHLRTSECA